MRSGQIRMLREANFLNPLLFGGVMFMLGTIAFFEKGPLVAAIAPLAISSFWLPIKIYFSRSPIYGFVYGAVFAALWFLKAWIVAIAALGMVLILGLGLTAARTIRNRGVDGS